MNKKELTEADIRTKYITPALVGVGVGKSNVMTQVREENFSGRATARPRATRPLSRR